jgi:hypothetical protein
MSRHLIRPVLIAVLLVSLPVSALGVSGALTSAVSPDASDTSARGGGVKSPITSTARAQAAPGREVTQQFAQAITAQQFTAITPYRTWDSRVNSASKLFAGDDFNIYVVTDYQDVPRIPANATAVSFNVTLTNTETTFGFVTIFNGDATAVPGTSTINWALSDFTIANGGIVALGGPGQFAGEIGVAVDGAPGAATELIVDITGYYTP